MDELDRQDLVQFVLDARDDLDWVMRVYADAQGERAGKPDDLAREAWHELLERAEFPRMIKVLESREYDPALERAGLGGTPLRFELAVIEAARGDAHRAADEHDPEPRPGEDPDEPAGRRWGRRVRAFLRKFLDALDIVLDSLVGALAGLGEAVKQFKDALRVRLDE